MVHFSLWLDHKYTSVKKRKCHTVFLPQKKLLVQWPKNTTAHPAQWPQTQEIHWLGPDSPNAAQRKTIQWNLRKIAVMIHQSAIFLEILKSFWGGFICQLFLPTFCQVAKSSGSRSDFKLSPAHVPWLTWSLVQSSVFAGGHAGIRLIRLNKQNGILQMMSG